MSRDGGVWRIRVDTGGTFTDGWALSPAGAVRRAKVLSSAALRATVVGGGGDRPLVHGGWTHAPEAAIGLRFGRVGEVGGWRVTAADTLDPGLVRLHLEAHGGQPGATRAVGPPETGDAVELQSSEPAPMLAARLMTRTPFGTPLPSAEMRLATTHATNALLERRVARTALIVNRGFGDVLTIGDQRRPDLFALAIRRPAAIVERTIEIGGRRLADGSADEPPDRAEVERIAAELVADGIESVAVCLLHDGATGEDERRVADWLRSAGTLHVSTSHEAVGRGGFVPRSVTTAVDACVAPILRRHLDAVQSAAGASATIRMLTSAGGLRRPERFRPVTGLLSGPAGGVAGAAAAATAAGLPRCVAFDMGGTSTDVARIEGRPVMQGGHRVGDASVLVPALAIETIAAGGGSICRWADGRLHVGPESAGATPGPACYGAGGPLTVTDCALLLGRIAPDRFPFPPDTAAAERAIDAVRTAMQATGERPMRRDELLAGFLQLAAESMAGAIRTVTVREGWDPRDHALVAFGGAAGQHAAAVARHLGITRVLHPLDGSLLSAVGVHHARPSTVRRREIERPLAGDTAALTATLIAELDAAEAELAAEDVAADRPRDGEIVLHLRRAGEAATLPVRLVAGPASAGEPRPPVMAAMSTEADAFGAALRTATAPASSVTIEARWADAARRRYGFVPAAADLVVESATVRWEEAGAEAGADVAPDAIDAARPRGRQRVHVGDGWTDVPVFERADLEPGMALSGPLIVVEDRGVVLVEGGWDVRVLASGAIQADERVAETADGAADATAAAPSSPARSDRPISRGRPRPADDPVGRELLARRLDAIAVDMGEQLRRTALSTNVRERLDYSCGVLDPSGRLLASAPHVPVHLGALGACVRSVIGQDLAGPGDVVVTNHPGFGGSHLPDVTVVAPVHDETGAHLGWVAARAHHAEIGGVRPGSMAPSAATLQDEGVVIPPIRLVTAGTEDFEDVAGRLRSAVHPSRSPEINLADLRAQVAACRRGAGGLRELAAACGGPHAGGTTPEAASAVPGLGVPPALAVASDARLRLTADLVRHALGRWAGRQLEAEDAMDDGSPVRVRISVAPNPVGDVRRPAATIDFNGSAGVHPGSLNAPAAVTGSAVAYVLRLLAGRDLPLNDGLLDPIDLRLPRGMLAPDFAADADACPAVAGGNVETSQRVVDVLLAAFGVVAGSQGTMNNVLFGDGDFGFYETVGGGAGAGPDFDGAAAVHVHMTNTALTDPETIERRFPIRLERCAIRAGSGGTGRQRGGDGMERVFRFLAPMRLSLLTQRRAVGPAGMDGGGPGAPGEQWILTAAGHRQDLDGMDECDVAAGDRLVLRTPGGGGWGRAGD